MTWQVIAATLLTLSGADLEYFDNFAVNPSFEEDVNRDGMPDGWSAHAFDSPAILSWDDSVAYDGCRSVSIRDSDRPDKRSDWKQCTGRWTTRPRPVRPGTKYHLEVWIKTDGVTGDAYAHLAWQRQGHWLNEVGTQRISGTSDWQKVSVTATAPSEADEVVVSLNLARSRGTAWFDKVTVSGMADRLPEVKYVFNDTSDWFPFEFPLEDTNLDTIDLTSFLDAPAGKHGFLKVGDDGHFYFPDGRRARFIGTNVGGTDCAPDKKDASVIAARLAKYGVNMLRLHAMDGRWGPLIRSDSPTSQELDAAALDRMDYFIAELKKRGIYIYMDLLDYRQFRTADGVAHADEFTHNWQGSMKGASIFDARMIELQKDFATRLLTHRNPYTGLRYADDPAIAVVETTNENSIFYFFTMSGLSLPYYRDVLTRRWNQWLIERYGDREGVSQAWTYGEGRTGLTGDEDPAEGTVRLPFGMISRIRGSDQELPPDVCAPRVSDMLRFFTEIQAAYYRTMHDHLRAIGVKAPIAGTNQSFVMIDTYIDSAINDFMTRNQYWRHPNRNAKPFFKFSNEPMITVDLPTQRNPLSVIARTSVAGKPQAVAEYNFPWPNEYRCEGWLLSAAYACLQDWDIFLYFSYSPDDHRLSMFRSQSDPARWGEFPAAALLFHRHDVAAGRNEVHVVHKIEDGYTPRPHTRYARYTNYRYLTFLSKVRNAFVQDRYDGNADVALACGGSADVEVADHVPVIRFRERPWDEWLYERFVEEARALKLPGYESMGTGNKRFESDTGELSLDYGRGLFTVDTARTQAVVGRLAAASRLSLSALDVRSDTDFAAVVVSSLDGKPVGRSRRMLVTAVARAENTAQGFWPPEPEEARRNTSSWMLPGEGRLPVIAEPVKGTIHIPAPGPVTAYALDSSGRRRRTVEVTTAGGAATLDPATARSIWIELVVP